MTQRSAGWAAWITGSAEGIGAATAEHLAADGTTIAIPVGRAGVPREAANVIAFPARKDPSFVSGQVICVAGGRRG